MKSRQNTINLGVENYFYKIEQLTQKDVEMLFKLVNNDLDTVNRQIGGEIIQNLLAFQRYVYLQKGKLADTTNLEQHLAAYQQNILELHHQKLEEEFIPLLACMVQNDIAFCGNPMSWGVLIHFLSAQFFRTRTVRNRIVKGAKQNHHYDPTRIMPIVAELLSLLHAGDIFAEGRRWQLVPFHNRTDIEFLTGDQPCLFSSHTEGEVTDSLYYPVSPRLAYVLMRLPPNSVYTPNPVSIKFVESMNVQMFFNAHRQVYGASESALLQADQLAQAWANAHPGEAWVHARGKV